MQCAIIMTSGVPAPSLGSYTLLDTTEKVDAVTTAEEISAHPPKKTNPLLLGSDSLYSVPNIEIGLQSVIHGDLSDIIFHEMTIIGSGVVLRPPLKVPVNEDIAECASSLEIGAHSVILDRVVCEASHIGAFCLIEEECVIGEGAKIQDGVWLRKGCVVPKEALLLSYTVYEGPMSTPVGKLNADVQQLIMRNRTQQKFRLKKAMSSS